MNRKDILLRAAYDLLTKASRDHFVQDAATEIRVHYDDADCDGYCLRDDIAAELDLDTEADPIPLREEEG